MRIGMFRSQSKAKGGKVGSSEWQGAGDMSWARRGLHSVEEILCCWECWSCMHKTAQGFHGGAGRTTMLVLDELFLGTNGPGGEEDKNLHMSVR